MHALSLYELPSSRFDIIIGAYALSRGWDFVVVSMLNSSPIHGDFIEV